MHLVAIGGSDAGISAALRARELDPTTEVTVVVADAYPNFSICGIPYYVSGEVTHWRNLAHRTLDDLKATGMQVRLNTLATKIDVAGRRLHVVDEAGVEDQISYDQLVVGTGRRLGPARPSRASSGPDALGPADGVHLLHSMGDTFELVRTLEEAEPASAVIVGAGYIGLEMAEGSTARGLSVTQFEQLPEVLPTVDPSLGALGQCRADRARHRRADQHDGQADRPGTRRVRPAASRSTRSSRRAPSSPPSPTWCWSWSASVPTPRWPRLPGAELGIGGAIAVDRGDADQPRACLRRRRLRRDPSPPAGPHLPAARDHGPQAGPGGRRERHRGTTASSPAASAPRS